MTKILNEPTKRPRPQIVTLSDAAAIRINDIIAKGDKPFLRVGVKNGGCAGMEYVMEYAEAPDAYDEIVNDKGVQILIAANAILFLVGTTIDVETTKFHSKFTFRNPNQSDACGCGESVTIVPFDENLSQ
jgi:iron-sulfur cluster assembly protein